MAVTLPTKVVTCQPLIRHRSGKVLQSMTDVLTTEPTTELIEYPRGECMSNFSGQHCMCSVSPWLNNAAVN